MNKTDQLRRQRELHHANQQSGSSSPAPAPPPSTQAADAEQGRCSACGKLRALVNGLLSNHQKGLGKMCPGSRKEPAHI